MRYNGSIKGVLNNSSPTSSPGMWSVNDVQENSTDANWKPDGSDAFEYLAVGGGGGGGGAVTSNTVGGGGGGGEVLSGTGPINLLTQYKMSIGAGGPGGNGFYPGVNGNPTKIEEPASNGANFSIEAKGGGGGSGINANNNPPVANGGGGSGGNSSSNGITGTAYNGGNGGEDANDQGGAGGGAGAGGNGSDGIDGGNGGQGGPGLLSNITGTNVYYGAGGGGGSNAGSAGLGGTGGGGPGGKAPSGGTSSTSDRGDIATIRSTGGGGGGAAVYGSSPSIYEDGAKGEYGCIILKYPNAYDISIDAYGHGLGTGPNSPASGIVKNHPDGVHKVATFRSGAPQFFSWVKSTSVSAKEI